MDMNLLGLPNPVEPPDALFQQLGIQRQIEQDEVMSELEVASFAANLRTDQQPRAVRLGEPRRIAIPLQKSQSFVENAGLDGQVMAKRRIDGFRLLNAATNQQHLLRIEL